MGCGFCFLAKKCLTLCRTQFFKSDRSRAFRICQMWLTRVVARRHLLTHLWHHYMALRIFNIIFPSPSSSSSSIGTTAHCGLSNNFLPFFPICHQLSPSSHSQQLKFSFCFLFPSFPGSSPSSRPFQISSDLFRHPILLH